MVASDSAPPFPTPLDRNMLRLTAAYEMLNECLQLLDECELNLSAAHLDQALQALRSEVPELSPSGVTNPSS